MGCFHAVRSTLSPSAFPFHSIPFPAFHVNCRHIGWPLTNITSPPPGQLYFAVWATPPPRVVMIILCATLSEAVSKPTTRTLLHRQSYNMIFAWNYMDNADQGMWWGGLGLGIGDWGRRSEGVAQALWVINMLQRLDRRRQWWQHLISFPFTQDSGLVLQFAANTLKNASLSMRNWNFFLFIYWYNNI